MASTETADTCRQSSLTIENSETIASEVATSATGTTTTSRSRLRRRPERRPVTFAVDFGVPASFRAAVSRDWILTTSCTAFWKHLLYARGLIPVPTNQLVLPKQQQQQQRLSSSQRKMLQTAEKLERMQTDFQEVVEQFKLNVRYVLLTLGASWTRPKEVYLLDFTGLRTDTDTVETTTGTCTAGIHTCSPLLLEENKENDASARLKKEYALSTRLIRQVVQEECDAESEQTGRDLLAAIQRASCDQLSITVGVTESSFQELFEEETAQASCATGPFILPKVIVRRDFLSLAAKQRKALRTARIRVFSKDAEVRDEDLHVEQEKEEELLPVDDDIMWLSLHSKVKGFRLPSSSPT